ncbi:CaiB/BaiF CoA-transferase family protein [Acuticoccus sp. I52.16.1]|uniref:CaiB/BaiF CoA transferase family protein n=1 Tax=Acuticoccus sp. I52.16.1 TaxID=2928472 RepID=UPI001FCFC653|nr:CoA transferase [Acuticoccus sp. I52.16.1]UOM32671.1 CoA transferase [Acuticoccus sp. I52.16.1]
MSTDKPLTGITVVEHARSVAAAYAGRLLAAMGAEVVMVEPPEGSALRREPPFLDHEEGVSALFAYHAVGKRSVVLDLATPAGRGDLATLLAAADIFIDDTPLAERPALGLDEPAVAAHHPGLVHLSVLPFGASGPKAGWAGEEINLVHAGGEGFLLPNGLSVDLFPDRPPLKVAGYFAQMQGGVTAVFTGLAALWAGGGRGVDVSVQDANVAIGCFAVQRLGDGSLEHRHERNFRYGGVVECADGFVELLTLEERQWSALVELMDRPAWATAPGMDDPAHRSARGADINERIRAWARAHPVGALVARAQRLGVPMAPYNTPGDVLADPHEEARRLFGDVAIDGVGTLPMQTAPFRFGPEPLALSSGPPQLGADQALVDRARPQSARRISA